MKNKYIITLFTIAVSLIACNKDFLDIKPEQSVLTEQVFSDMSASRATVNGLYSLMQSTSYYGRDAMVIPEVLSDNMTRSVKTGNRYTGMNTMTHTATDANVTRMWSQIYRVVTNANAVIANEENIKKAANASQKEEALQLVGEAYAVRAMAYFDLIKFFARPLNHTTDGSHLGVPLVLSPITSISEVVYPARNTTKEVYDRIYLDIEEALKRLQASGNVIYDGVTNSTLQKIRFNVFSTLALKTRVAIYTADWQ